MNNKVYIHEYIDIILQGRPAYMHHMTKGWGSKGRDPKRNMLMVGVWGTLGSTARWPEVINLWEHDGWHGIAKCFKHETGNPLMQDPELLMLDEPVAGMSVSERQKTAELLTRISNNRSVIVIEHDMEFVKSIAHRVTVLHQGKTLAEGSMDHVQADPRVIEVYLGH